MLKPFSPEPLAKIIFSKDVKPHGEVSVSAMFYGALKVTLEGSRGDKSYTYQKKPGEAKIVIGFWQALSAAGLTQTGAMIPGQDVPRSAKKIKAAMLGILYHELGHLKCTDMTGEPFEAAKAKIHALADKIAGAPDAALRANLEALMKEFSNICEDPAMENLLPKDRLYRFTERYFSYLRKMLFIPMAKKYKDGGELRDLFWYILLYYRVGPKAIAEKNAMFESLRPKGIIQKLSEVYREKDPRKRCDKQIDLGLWIIDELGLKKDQIVNQEDPVESQRPVIILIDPDPNAKSKTRKLRPEIGKLPPLSVSDGTGSEEEGGEDGEDGESEDPIIIDKRKNKPEGEGDPEDGEGSAGQGKGSDEGDEDADGSDGEAEGDADEEAGDEAEGEEGGKGDGQSQDDAGGDQAGQGGGVESQEGKDRSGEGEDAEFGDGSLEDGDDPSDDYDPDLDQTLAMSSEGNESRWGNARDGYSPIGDAAQQRFDAIAAQNAGLTTALAIALKNLKEESAPEIVSRLDSGDEVNLDDFVEIRSSGSPSLEFFQEEIPGREITDLAVSILVDCSGSMGGVRSQTAFSACCLIAVACESAEVPFEVAAYSSTGPLWLKSFDDDLLTAKPMFGILDDGLFATYDVENNPDLPYLWGGTTTEDATAMVVQGLRAYEGKACKLLFVITDGCTSDPQRMRDVVERARNDGIVVIGIGIGIDKDALRRNFGKCTAFDNRTLGALPEYVASQIKEAMSTPEFQNR